MNYEEQARKEGWVPLEEFKGDPEAWKDAERFVKDGENILPIVRSKLKRTEEQGEELKKELGELKQTVKDLADFHKKAITVAEQKAAKEGYEKAVKELKALQRSAVEAGDTETFDKAEQELNKLEVPKEREPQDQAPPEFEPWRTKNQWYMKDKSMTDYAQSVANFVKARTPGILPAQFYEEITEEVKKRFPEKFEVPDAPPTVEGATTTTPKKSGRTYNDLPAEAKQACDRYVKQGLMSKKEYLDTYFGEVE